MFPFAPEPGLSLQRLDTRDNRDRVRGLSCDLPLRWPSAHHQPHPEDPEALLESFPGATDHLLPATIIVHTCRACGRLDKGLAQWWGRGIQPCELTHPRIRAEWLLTQDTQTHGVISKRWRNNGGLIWFRGETVAKVKCYDQTLLLI